MFKIKFPTKRIFRIFPILRINGMAPFCNLFMERPSYNILLLWSQTDHCESDIHNDNRKSRNTIYTIYTFAPVAILSVGCRLVAQ